MEHSEPKASASVHDDSLASKEHGGIPMHQRNVPDGYFPQTDAERALSRAVNRKLDFFVLPFLSLLYLFNGLDRGNVGNAQTQGFAKDIGAKASAVNDAVSLFFITFVVFQPISAGFGRFIGPKWWIPLMMIAWGALTLAHAFIRGRGQLIALRLLIGVFEAGFYPTSLFYLSTFYTRFDLGVRMGVFFGQYAIAGAFSSAIAYGIFHIKGALDSWQYLFIIEGALTMFIALIALFWLPIEPSTAWFLTQSEREFAAERMRKDNERYITKDEQSDGIRIFSRGLTKRDVIETLKDWKLWTVLVVNICASVPSQAFSVFLPLVVKGMGFSSIEANLMSVPPYVCGAVGLYIFTFSSDRFKERGYHIVGGLVICLVGLIMTITILEDHGRYIGLCILLAGSYIMAPLTMAWLSGNTPEPGKRSLVLGVNGFGNLAGVIGSQLFRPKYAPRYLVPFYAALGFIAFSIIGYLAYRFTLQAVNKHRAQRLSSWSESDIENEQFVETRLGDKKYTFVYSL